MLKGEHPWGALAQPTQARARVPFPKRVTDHRSVRTLHGRTPGNSGGRLVVRILAWDADFLVQSPVRGTLCPLGVPVPRVGCPLHPRSWSRRFGVTERDGSDHAEAPAINYISKFPYRA